MNSWNPLKLQDFEPIFVEFPGGGPPDPPLNTHSGQVLVTQQFTLNPSQTYIATALRPLRDWQFSPIAEVATRSPIGPGEVAEKSATDRGPRCDQISRSQVFCACTKTWLRLIWSQTGPGEVADQSPISRRLVADRSPTNFVRIGAWLSLKLVGDWSAIGRRLVGDRSATNRGLLRDLTATSWRPVRNLF